MNLGPLVYKARNLYYLTVCHVRIYLIYILKSLLLQPREKQVEIDQLQYELGASNRRNQAEIASLRQRISDLELQLLQARKEADEYYKGNLERNMEVTALGQEVLVVLLVLGLITQSTIFETLRRN